MSDLVLIMAYAYMEQHPEVSLYEALDHLTVFDTKELMKTLEEEGKI